MSYLYHTFVYNPLLNLLVLLYNTLAFKDFGLSIIFLTIIIRLILFPFFQKGAYYQAMIQKIQPELKKIQENYKKDKLKQAEETMALYKKYKINPFTPFSLLLVQLPILIALYQIFLKSISSISAENLYSFVKLPEQFNLVFLGLIDMAKPSILMVGLAAISQYFQTRLAFFKTKFKSKEDKSLNQVEKINRQMLYLGPVLTFLIFSKLPAAISLYWLVSSVFSVFQQIIINRQLLKKEI